MSEPWQIVERRRTLAAVFDHLGGENPAGGMVKMRGAKFATPLANASPV
jgi:hypothetical protein